VEFEVEHDLEAARHQGVAHTKAAIEKELQPHLEEPDMVGEFVGQGQGLGGSRHVQGHDETFGERNFGHGISVG